MRFEAAQTAVQIEIKVLLALAGLLQLVGQGLDLAAQAGDFLRLALDLRCQIELRLGLLVKARFAAGFEVGDPLARFLVVKQGPGRGGGQGGGNQESQGQAAQHDQNSPRPSGAR